MFAYFDRFNPTGFVDNWWMVDLYGINVGNIIYLGQISSRPHDSTLQAPKRQKKRRELPLVKSIGAEIL